MMQQQLTTIKIFSSTVHAEQEFRAAVQLQGATDPCRPASNDINHKRNNNDDSNNSSNSNSNSNSNNNDNDNSNSNSSNRGEISAITQTSLDQVSK